MRSIKMQVKSGPDGVLHLSLPVEMADQDYFVLVELHPLLKDWPPGYEELYGSITDESFFPEIPNEEQPGS